MASSGLSHDLMLMAVLLQLRLNSCQDERNYAVMRRELRPFGWFGKCFSEISKYFDLTKKNTGLTRDETRCDGIKFYLIFKKKM